MTLTPRAVEHAKKLFEKNNINPPPGGLRFLVKAGGCSGLKLTHKLENSDTPHDIVTLAHGVRVITDPKSLAVLAGKEIDHPDDLTKPEFVINARSVCGCGQSFQS